MDKNKIKQALIDNEEHHIENANRNYAAFLNGNLLNRQDVIDADDQSHHRASLEVSDRFDKSIHDHTDHLNTINQISFEPTDIIKPGAVIKVNGRCMIVAVPKSAFTIEGQDFIGISTNAPIYDAISGKRAGDEFVYNDTTFKIDAVY